MLFVNNRLCNGIRACNANGVCVLICAANAIRVVDGRPLIDKSACSMCGLCMMNCPREAIQKGNHG